MTNSKNTLIFNSIVFWHLIDHFLSISKTGHEFNITTTSSGHIDISSNYFSINIGSLTSIIKEILDRFKCCVTVYFSNSNDGTEVYENYQRLTSYKVTNGKVYVNDDEEISPLELVMRVFDETDNGNTFITAD